MAMVVEALIVFLACMSMSLQTLARPQARSIPAAVHTAKRVIQLGTDMMVTTHLVKSPRAMWVIGKLVYLTKKTAVEVKPKEVLVMSRPYGPPQITPWLSSPPSHSRLLYHDASQKLYVVLTQINSLVIFYENSEFDISIKQEVGSDISDASSGDGKGGTVTEFDFLSVRLSQTTAIQVDATVGVLTTTPAPTENVTLPTPPAMQRHPSFQYHGHPFTFFQELKLFFSNMKELVNYGAELFRNSKFNRSFSGLIELYRPRRSDGSPI